MIFPAAVLDDLMKVLSEWWKTIKDHEALLQTLCRDPAGHVSDGYPSRTAENNSNRLFRIASCLLCFIMDQRKKGARTSRNFMISVSEASKMLGRLSTHVTRTRL